MSGILEDAQNYTRQTLGVLLELADEHKRLGTELDEAVGLITALWQYATIREVEGVVYGCGTHREVIDKAGAFLANHAAKKS